MNEDQAPVVVAPESASGTEGGVLSFDVTASDPDGDPIATLAADLGPDGRAYGFPGREPDPALGTPAGALSSQAVPVRGWVEPAHSEVRLDVTGRGIVVRIEIGAGQAALSAVLAGPGGRVGAGRILPGGDLDGNGVAE